MIERSEPMAINGDCGLVKKTLNLMTGRFFLDLSTSVYKFLQGQVTVSQNLYFDFICLHTSWIILLYYRKLENNTAMRFMNFMELALDHTYANQ